MEEPSIDHNAISLIETSSSTEENSSNKENQISRPRLSPTYQKIQIDLPTTSVSQEKSEQLESSTENSKESEIFVVKPNNSDNEKEDNTKNNTNYSRSSSRERFQTPIPEARSGASSRASRIAIAVNNNSKPNSSSQGSLVRKSKNIPQSSITKPKMTKAMELRHKKLQEEKKVRDQQLTKIQEKKDRFEDNKNNQKITGIRKNGPTIAKPVTNRHSKIGSRKVSNASTINSPSSCQSTKSFQMPKNITHSQPSFQTKVDVNVKSTPIPPKRNSSRGKINNTNTKTKITNSRKRADSNLSEISLQSSKSARNGKSEQATTHSNRVEKVQVTSIVKSVGNTGNNSDNNKKDADGKSNVIKNSEHKNGTKLTSNKQISSKINSSESKLVKIPNNNKITNNKMTKSDSTRNKTNTLNKDITISKNKNPSTSLSQAKKPRTKSPLANFLTKTASTLTGNSVKNKSIASLTKKLNETEQECDHLKIQNMEIMQQLQDLEKVSKARDLIMNSQTETIENLNLELLAKNVSQDCIVGAKNNLLIDQNDSLMKVQNQHIREIANLKALVLKKEDKLNEKNQALERALGKIQALNEQNDQQSNKILNLEQTKTEKQQQIAENLKQITSLKSTTDDLESKLQASNQEKQTFFEFLAENKTRLEKITKERDDWIQKSKNLETQILETENNIENQVEIRLTEQLHHFQNARSEIDSLNELVKMRTIESRNYKKKYEEQTQVIFKLKENVAKLSDFEGKYVRKAEEFSHISEINRQLVDELNMSKNSISTLEKQNQNLMVRA